MIRGMSLAYPVSPSIGYAISAAQGGRTSLPVAPSSYIYSHFKHVSGVPAPDGIHGVAITDLKILDALIEQLSKIKQRPEITFDRREAMTDERIDALIRVYENQIRQARTANAAMPYKPRPEAPLGAVFSVVVA